MKTKITTRRSSRLRSILSATLLTSSILGLAQTDPTPQALPYAENFSTVAHTSTVYPAGWQGWTISTSPSAAFNTGGPTADRALVASSSASTTSGNVHNYNGAIGFLNSGSLDLTLCLSLSTTGNSNVQVAYDIMTIRNPYDGGSNTRINEVTLQYRIGNSGSWTTLTGPEYQNNTTLQTGSGVTTPQNLQNRSITLPIACDNQPVVQVRWASRQVSGGGSRPSFALDNINVTGSALGNTTVAFTTAASTVSEGVGTTNLVLSINDPSPTQATSVDVVITAGSAARVNNYTTQTVVFPANDGSDQTLTITVTDDGVYDGGGVVTFSLQNITGGQGTAAIGAPSDHNLTITENEPSPLLLNEIDYDNDGTVDSLEFVEIVNTGLIPIDLNGYKIELVNGAGGAVYTTITLPSFSLAPGGYYVVGNDASIPNINLVTGPNTNFIQNGSPDAVGLRDPANNLLDAVSYEGSTLAPYTEGTGISVANSDDNTPGIGISRFPDGSDTNDNSVDWSRRCLSPGAPNNSTFENCICTPPDVTVSTECIDDNSWRIVVTVNNTGSGATVDITNDFNLDQVLGVGPGTYFIAGGGFPNNAVVTLTVAHETFGICDLTFGGLTNNCLPDCNGVVGGFDLPGNPCDDGDPQTQNDTWSATCVCEGSIIQPTVSFTTPFTAIPENGVAVTVGVEMVEAPSAPVVVEVTDDLTGSATSGSDYTAIGTLQFTFLPTDIYPNTQTFNILITDDNEYEAPEIANFSLNVVSGPADPGLAIYVLVIQSDDPATLVINEVDYDNAGNDNAEWIELKNTGTAAIDLSGFSVQLVNGSNNTTYQTFALPAFSLPGGGYYVIGNNAAIPNIDLVVTPATNLIQNGSPDAVVLFDPASQVLDAVTYEGDMGAPFTEGTGMPLSEADDNVNAERVIARYLDGNDTNDNSVDWKAWCATPGASNTSAPDADGDATPDCVDGCPNDGNKIAPGVCGCGNPDPGSACNDNNPFTANDVVDGLCQCIGTPVPCDDWTLTIDAGSDGSQIAWQITDANSPFVLATGGPYANNSTNAVTVCIPQEACLNLTFTDDANGIAGGGWLLEDNTGRRILDNVNNGGCFSGTSTTAAPFCNEPASAQTVIAIHCDKENWLPNDVIIASANPLVSAEYGIGDQTDDGYQFWFQSPCGGYSRRIFRSHAVSGGQGPANAVRATKLALASIVTNPLPIGELLNVRVRSRVNGDNGAWGPACRFKIDPTACTITQLNNYSSSPNFSCGVTGKLVGGSGNAGKIFANVVTSGGNPADHYRFQFEVPGEGYLRNIVSTNAVCVLGIWASNPLLCGTYEYDVRVQASFDGGSTYCPFGPTCTVEITNSQADPFCTTPGAMVQGADTRMAQGADMDLTMYPNPNRGDQLFLNMARIDEQVDIVSVDIYDGFGKRVTSATLPVQGGSLNTVIALRTDMASGLYLVNITAGGNTRTERLVIQH